jgi:hypothetical protein
MGKKKGKSSSTKHKGGRTRALVQISEFVSTKTHECSDFINGSVCSDKNILNAIVMFNNDQNGQNEQPLQNGQPLRSESDAYANGSDAYANGSDNQLKLTMVKQSLDGAKQTLKCDSESCVVSHPTFQKFAIKNKIASNSELEENLDTRFKIEGPRNSTAWLSNYDIDKTLEDWAFKFEDFFPCPFAMIDFDRMGDPLHRYNMHDIYNGKHKKNTIMGTVKLPCRTFGCAINTDVTAGKGKHWMALFVDMRGSEVWTIEFFNSTGAPPQKSIVNWMKKTKENLEDYLNQIGKKIKVEIIITSHLEHQESNTECGLYTLFYIRARIENVPYDRFLKIVIPDENMIEFRKHCFRSPSL